MELARQASLVQSGFFLAELGSSLLSKAGRARCVTLRCSSFCLGMEGNGRCSVRQDRLVAAHSVTLALVSVGYVAEMLCKAG